MSPTRGPSWHAAAPSGGTILLVEDDDDFARMLALYLGDEGYDVVTVEDGAQAVHTVFELEPDVILMDTHIPGLDGLQSTTRLRQAGYAGPIVALSAAPGDELKYQALQAGCDDFVSKPVDVDELLAAIRRRPRRSGGLSVSAHVAQQRLRSDFQSSFGHKADRLDACWRAIECSDWGLSELQTLQQLVHRLAGSSGFYGFAAVALPAGKLDEQLSVCISQSRVSEQARAEIVRCYIELLSALARISHHDDEPSLDL